VNAPDIGGPVIRDVGPDTGWYEQALVGSRPAGAGVPA
jgi:hypothetical protein